MKVKVIKRFNDKYTKEYYKLNKELEVTEERYQEIKKYVEIINDEAFEETVKKSGRRKG